MEHIQAESIVKEYETKHTNGCDFLLLDRGGENNNIFFRNTKNRETAPLVEIQRYGNLA